LLSSRREDLVDFLGREGHGRRDTLMGLFQQIERTTDDLLAITRWSMHPHKCDPIYEWPTDELCATIHAILRHEKCSRIVEIAAGTGILAARLNATHIKTPHHIKTPLPPPPLAF
jgi:hypothetical protein